MHTAQPGSLVAPVTTLDLVLSCPQLEAMLWRWVEIIIRNCSGSSASFFQTTAPQLAYWLCNVSLEQLLFSIPCWNGKPSIPVACSDRIFWLLPKGKKKCLFSASPSSALLLTILLFSSDRTSPPAGIRFVPHLLKKRLFNDFSPTRQGIFLVSICFPDWFCTVLRLLMYLAYIYCFSFLFFL